MHARWHEAAARLAAGDADRDAARTAVRRGDGRTGRRRGGRRGAVGRARRAGALERERREAHDTARVAATTPSCATRGSHRELEALERERAALDR